MKIKLQIKTFGGTVLFELEKENNTVKDTLIQAVAEKKGLRGAYLRDADLRGADLRDADLRDADLRDADLRDADLSGADLRGADLRDVKEDLFEILTILNGEVPNLLQSLREGKIKGNVYEGDCCCLVGTIAKIKNCQYTEIPGLTPDASRPAERFFLSIRPGHTPENSKKVKEIEGWILEYMEKQKAI